MSDTVKARKHHGTDSLDLTIPSKVVRENDINPGDVFEIVVEGDEQPSLRYRRVYANK